MAQARQFTNSTGMDVLAITAPFYNEPDCFNAACHFHGDGQTLLGTLDIGLSQDPLKQTLGQLQNRMIMFSGMILILTVGAVCAILYRHVFLPIKQLAAFTADPMNDNLEGDFPDVSGEVARLAQSFQRMSRRMQELEHRLRSYESDMSPPDSGL